MDLACSALLGAVVVALAVAYAARVARSGRAAHARVEKEGKSALLSKGAMEMMCWGAGPIVWVCVRLGISADSVTFAALATGIASGIAFGAGHFGLGALLATTAGAADAVDGLVARRQGTASASGEVLDAAIDRYVDFAWLGGLAFYFRERAGPFVLVLFAVLATFMISYGTAKAEALGVEAPRGSMRRVERAVLLVGAAALTPLATYLDVRPHEIPIILAIGAIALLGNESAIRRLRAVRAAVRERETSPTTGPAQATR